MNTTTHAIALVILGLVVLAAAGVTWRYWRGQRREQLMLRLFHAADRVEARIKQCRLRLHQGAGTMPGAPAATAALDAALRNLLTQRLWLRDRAPQARDAELRAVAQALEEADARLAGELDALLDARAELHAAVRELQDAQ